MSAAASAPPLAVSMGDPAGIGLDITLMAWHHRDELGVPPFVLYAPPDTVAARARALALHVPIAVVANPNEAADHFSQALPLRPIEMPSDIVPGVAHAKHAAAILSSIEEATAAVVRGEAAALVTNPIAKLVLYQAGFPHAGHTEFLAALAARHHPGRNFLPVMMLASEMLRVVPVTIHIPLSRVPSAITRPLINDTVRITHAALMDSFGISHPRIAVCGLNPHAGEGGTIGREDVEVIAPAIADLCAEGLSVTGPLSADTLFHAAARKTYDAAVCMYHDQALIPIKTLAFDEGVNVTLGLPFVRTSPDHGTAFSIAATGTASPASFIAACKLAHDMSRRRAAAHAHARAGVQAAR